MSNVELLRPEEVELLINPAIAAMEAVKSAHKFTNLQVVMAMQYYVGVALHQAGIKLDPELPMHRTLGPLMLGYLQAPNWAPVFGNEALPKMKHVKPSARR